MTVIRINVPGREYDIIIGAGAVSQLPEQLRGRKAFVVSDSNVMRLHGETLTKTLSGSEFRIAVIEPGENSKTIENASELWRGMAKFGLRRGDAVIAFGGGVVGDLAGFTASAYMRGVSCIQIPTTLVSHFDSSVGGKTAVNIPEGKNLVGAFCQPEAVIADIDFLSTLPEREVNAGLAEAVKHSLISGESLPPLDDLEALTAFNCSVKAKFVEADEFDRGERMFLNFGHTFGHAIEKYFNFERFNHGEAVAKGMVLALNAGIELGVTPERVRESALTMMENARLDLTLDINPGEIIPLMNSDKKNGAGTINLVLLKDLGKPVVVPVKKLEKKPFGVIKLPPSKSVLHRGIILSALTNSLDYSEFNGVSEDIDATLRCMRELKSGGTVLDCGESGSTLRFLIPIAAALGRSVNFAGKGRLLERPLTPLLDELSRHGVQSELTRDSFTVSGKLKSGAYKLPGDVSSQ
ncbi:MAG: 3-dehydroquinate synthase, partial [Oscillospiraceae bacterium]|nr:3-dehydroquinate synthase [Oscillospiraceae bacterium]